MRDSYRFQWFAPETGRKQLRASIGKDGKLHLGQSLRSVLPPYILIGFDAERRVLAIADGHGQGSQWNKAGIVAAQDLSCQITSLGLELPLVFQITRDAATGYFLGHIILRLRRTAGRRCAEFDPDQALIIYQHILRRATTQVAKTTPLAERRALAREALITALQHYRPGYGDLETYLDAQIRAALIRENRSYVASFRDRSLDRPFSPSSGNAFCLYDTLGAGTDGGLAAVEERIMEEQFWDRLSPEEQQLTQMLQDGLHLPQIASHLHKTEEDLTKMAHTIAQKRKDFYAVA